MVRGGCISSKKTDSKVSAKILSINLNLVIMETGLLIPKDSDPCKETK